MNAYLLDNGSLLIPGGGSDGDILYEGAYEALPGSREYEEWLPFAIPLPEHFREEDRELTDQEVIVYLQSHGIK